LAHATSGGDSSGIFRPAGTPALLPIAELPAFNSYSSYDASASASLPLGTFSGMFGGRSSKSVALSVRFSDVSTYGIPAAPALVKLMTYCGLATDDAITETRCTDQYLWRVYHSATRINLRGPMVVAMVYRVYLARQINFSFTQDARNGLSADMQLLLDKALADQKAASKVDAAKPASVPSTSASQASTASFKPVSGADALDEARQSASGTQQPPLVAGGPHLTFSFGGANGEIINVTETFDRPVPVGYQAVAMNGL
jgi:hypothetical protein